MIVLILAVISFGGYYVWHAQHSKTPPLATKKDNEFVFKELGVKITLPDALKGLSYKVESRKNNQGGTSTVLYLGSPSMSDAVEQCYNQKVDSNSPGNFGAIDKLDGQYSPNTAGPTEGPPLKQFDNFYIEGSQPNGITTCTNPKVDAGLAQHEAGKLFTELTEAFKTATLVQ